MEPRAFDFDVITDPEERRERRPWTPLLHVPPSPARAQADTAEDVGIAPDDAPRSRA